MKKPVVLTVPMLFIMLVAVPMVIHFHGKSAKADEEVIVDITA